VAPPRTRVAYYSTVGPVCQHGRRKGEKRETSGVLETSEVWCSEGTLVAGAIDFSFERLFLLLP